MKEVYLELAAENGLTIPYIEEVPPAPKAIIIVTHGYAGHSGQYRHFSSLLFKNGYGVYSFDQRGHGRSKTEKGHLDRFEDFIDDLKTVVTHIKINYPDTPLYLFGHSMGGLVAFTYGILYPHHLAGEILSAPALGMPWGTQFIPDAFYSFIKRHLLKFKIYPVVRRPACRTPHFRKTLDQDPYVLRYSTAGFFYEFIFRGINWAQEHAEEFTLPCLLLHGTKDKIIPYHSSTEILRKISSDELTFKSYPGLYHELLQEPENQEVINDIVNWLELRTQLQPAKSS